MYKLFLIFAAVLCFQSDTSEISWNQNYKLTWQDFKGKPNKETDAVAVTASGITFGYSIKKSSTKGITGFNTTVLAHFYPEHSWCKKDVVDDHVLAHEQLHFDITELNTRYFREKISKLKVSNTIADVLNSIHKKTNEELEAMQQRYDNESEYSINKEGQSKWSTFVSKELKRLQEFQSQK
ncbi:hypothetical protein [uncultured Lacinutrix sp.]|uniref:DUF922 domain-containing protein n=1 Tax=uncultured Lacinutrix sp. TaxID=574032 RepID=UPI0026248B36|nr:hypothetical protein [uncultured Lacinutrix sp.]